jgi:glycosyltransferase involved in cell wall biosynthesis
MAMRILYKHRKSGTGAEGIHINEMVAAFKSLGHEVDFSCPIKTFDRQRENNKFRKLLELSSKWTPPILYEILTTLWSFHSYYIGRNALLRRNYDLIYERYSIFDFSNILLSRKFNLPTILEVNGLVNTDDIARIEKTSLEGFARLLEKKIMLTSSLIAVVTNKFKEDLVKIGISPSKIIVTTNAVSDGFFKYDKKNCELIRKRYNITDKIIIGFVGGFNPWQHIDLLICCLPSLLSRYPNVHLLLVGDGPEKTRLELVTKKASLSKHVTFTGRIRHSEIPSHIGAMDITTLPGSTYFSAPMKIFEYMALKKPVVCASLAVDAGIIEDRENGFLFQPGNEGDFAQKLLALIEDDELRKKMGEKGYQKVTENHTWKKNAESILDAYNRMNLKTILKNKDGQKQE